MSDKLSVPAAINTLKQNKSNLCCKEVKELLTKLGFDVRDGSNGGHKIFVHPNLSSFQSSSFNCGHGKNPEIKQAYINKIIKILEQHSEELEKYLKGSDTS